MPVVGDKLGHLWSTPTRLPKGSLIPVEVDGVLPGVSFGVHRDAILNGRYPAYPMWYLGSEEGVRGAYRAATFSVLDLRRVSIASVRNVNRDTCRGAVRVSIAQRLRYSVWNATGVVKEMRDAPYPGRGARSKTLLVP